MGIDFLIKGVIIGLSVSIPLGPIGVMCIQRTLSKGRLSGFVSGMGAASADIIYSIFAGLGITFIIDILTKYSIEFQVIGGAFLLFLGLRLFFKNPIKQFRQPKTKGGLVGDFLSTFFLTITNPLALFLFVGVFATIGFMNTKFEHFTLGYIVAGVALGTTLWWFVLSTLINLFRSKIRLRKLNWINKISGIAIFIFGVVAIVNLFFTFYKF
jgi:threonine/homoserine/homoserine lactone efflux protein